MLSTLREQLISFIYPATRTFRARSAVRREAGVGRRATLARRQCVHCTFKQTFQLNSPFVRFFPRFTECEVYMENIPNAYIYLYRLTGFGFPMIAMRVNAVLAIAVTATGTTLLYSDIARRLSASLRWISAE